MTYLYKVFDCKLNLLVATRDFGLAMDIYANADKKDGWPLFTYEPAPALAIPGDPDAFLPAQA